MQVIYEQDGIRITSTPVRPHVSDLGPVIYEALLWRAGCGSIMGVHLRTYVRLQVFHYATPGPVALRLDWNNISITFSGKLNLDGSAVKSHISLMCF